MCALGVLACMHLPIMMLLQPLPKRGGRMHQRQLAAHVSAHHRQQLSELIALSKHYNYKVPRPSPGSSLLNTVETKHCHTLATAPSTLP